MSNKAIVICGSIRDKNCYGPCIHGEDKCCAYCDKFATCMDRCGRFKMRLNQLVLLLVYAGQIKIKVKRTIYKNSFKINKKKYKEDLDGGKRW